MGKSRKMARKSHKRHSKKQTRRMRNKRRNGGGYTDMPSKFINPGNVVHQQYSGPGMDCGGSATRPGYLNSNSFAGTGGLPGLNGKLFGGATQLGSGGPVVPPAVANAGVQGFRGYTTGAASELAQMAPAQVGGRWGTDVGAGPLNPTNGVGTTPGPFGRVHCETGTTDPLNPNPGRIQELTTAPGYVPGWSHYLPNMFKGGKRKTKKVRGGAQLNPAPLTVSVGDVDSMRYYAPTAGYSNFPLAPPVMNNPGILMQTPYNAREFNMACLKTGGARNNKKNGGEGEVILPVEEAEVAAVEANVAAQQATDAAANASNAAANASNAAKAANAAAVIAGGAYPVAAMAGQFTPVTIGDYKSGMLPVKFGGKKANKRRNKTRRGGSGATNVAPQLPTLVGGAFKAFDDTQIPMTPGMPVASQAGNFPNFQRIAIGHYIPGSSINNPPVSRPAAGGARKNRKNKKNSK